MTVTLRFAPSPTGNLHVGNIRVAILNWFFVKQKQGKLILRLDDTDKERSKIEYVESIKRDLQWLGLQWDQTFSQSERFERYDYIIEKLKKEGHLYPCYETPQELDLKRKLQLSQGKPPIYDREALNLTEAQKEKYAAENRKPHWRFKLKEGKVHWHDLVRGMVEIEPTKMSDPVLVREDGVPLFTLTSVIDDTDTNISHIFRGEDHVANTAIQIQIFESIGAEKPEFAHFPLILDKDGHGLSKRMKSLSINDLREKSIEPSVINAFLLHLGSSEHIDAQTSTDKLIQEFNLDKFGRAAPKFDESELFKLNAKFLHQLSYEEVKNKIDKLDLKDETIANKFWHCIRENIDTMDDVKIWKSICFGDEIGQAIELNEDDQRYRDTALKLLPSEPWDENTWGQWTSELKQETGRKGKNLFMPLRRMMTGFDHGPELKFLLPLLGRERLINRFKKF